MSWSTYTVAKPDQVADRVEALEPPGEGSPERNDQVRAAKASAIALVESGAVGTGPAFTISIAGHSNPHHAGNDSLTVSVSQVATTAVDQFDQAQAANQANLQ